MENPAGKLVDFSNLVVANYSICNQNPDSVICAMEGWVRLLSHPLDALLAVIPAFTDATELELGKLMGKNVYFIYSVTITGSSQDDLYITVFTIE